MSEASPNRLLANEIMDAEEVDDILERLGELMRTTSSPTLRSILLETADEIAELLNEGSDDDTWLEANSQSDAA